MEEERESEKRREVSRKTRKKKERKKRKKREEEKEEKGHGNDILNTSPKLWDHGEFIAIHQIRQSKSTLQLGARWVQRNRRVRNNEEESAESWKQSSRSTTELVGRHLVHCCVRKHSVKESCV